MRFLVLLFCLLAVSAAHAVLTDESEVSLLNSGGNSKLQSYNVKTVNKYEFENKDTYNFGGHYTYGEANSSLSARNWDVNNKYAKSLDNWMSIILGETIEGNKFQDVKVRYNSDLGLRYQLRKTERTDWITEGSYRYTIEDRYVTDNVYQSKSRLYTEFNRKQSETMQWKLWLEYLPNFTDGHDWMMTGEASVTAIMTSLFSVKVAYKGLYDNQPAASGLKNYDYITTTSLVAKF